MESSQLSLTEHAVLGVLAEGPTHGFAISKALSAGADLGRILTVRRPLVYRALDRLVEAGLIEPAHTEPGEAGPRRVVHRITSEGRRRLAAWLESPVEHVRDLRIEFLLKVVLLDRSAQTPLPLIRAQRAVLDPTLAALDDAAGDDPVELWRRHTAAAAGSYLVRLEQMYRRR